MNLTNRPFVSWLIVVAITACGLTWAHINGVTADAVEHDKFHVVTLMFVWFVAATAVAGRACYSCEPSTSLERDQLLFDRIDRMNSFLWFSAGSLLNLGLAGTVYGFIAMLDSAFVGKNFSDPNVVPSLLPVIGENWATALYATAVGVTLNVALAVQVMISDLALRRMKSDWSCR